MAVDADRRDPASETVTALPNFEARRGRGGETVAGGPPVRCRYCSDIRCPARAMLRSPLGLSAPCRQAVAV